MEKDSSHCRMNIDSWTQLDFGRFIDQRQRMTFEFEGPIRMKSSSSQVLFARYASMNGLHVQSNFTIDHTTADEFAKK